MKIQLPSANNVKDGAAELAAEAVRDAADGIRNGVENGTKNGNGRWIRLPKLHVPRIEVADFQLPEVRLPRVIGAAVRPVPDQTRRQFDALLAAAATSALSLGGRLAKAGARAIVTRRATPLQRAGFAMPIVGVVIVAAGTGAVLAYAFDPVSGRARRARARARLSAGAHRFGRQLGRTQRYVGTMVAGRVEQMRESRREIAAQAGSRPRGPEFDMTSTRIAEPVGVMSGAGSNGLA